MNIELLSPSKIYTVAAQPSLVHPCEGHRALPSVSFAITLEVGEKAQIKLLSVSEDDDDWPHEECGGIQNPLVANDEYFVAAADLQESRIRTPSVQLKGREVCMDSGENVLGPEDDVGTSTPLSVTPIHFLKSLRLWSLLTMGENCCALRKIWHMYPMPAIPLSPNRYASE